MHIIQISLCKRFMYRYVQDVSNNWVVSNCHLLGFIYDALWCKCEVNEALVAVLTVSNVIYICRSIADPMVRGFPGKGV